MFQLGGKYWEYWKPSIERTLLSHQRTDGSWLGGSGRSREHRVGPVYCTAMAALALSVQYRYLPIYQR